MERSNNIREEGKWFYFTYNLLAEQIHVYQKAQLEVTF